MAEYMHEGHHGKEYASKGVAGAGLGLGIAGTAIGLGALGGGFDGLFGRRHGGHEEHHGGGHINKFELMQSERIAALESANATLRSEKFTLERIGCVEKQVERNEVQLAMLNQAFRDFRCETKEEFCEVNKKLNSITATVIPASLVVTVPPSDG